MEKKTLLKGALRSMGPFILATFLLSVSFQSCQKEELPDMSDQQIQTDPVFHNLKSGAETIFYPDVFAGPVTFSPVKGKMITQNTILSNADYANFEPVFKLVMQNGDELGENTVMGANIYVNQVLVASLADFRKAALTMGWAIDITGADTQIDVEVKGKTNGILTIWIEGFLKGGPLPTFIDSRDGNEYEMVTYGTQTWMAKNMAYLPTVNMLSENSISEPIYYVYGYDGNDPAAAKATPSYQTYGALYNWTAAQTACPAGWHLPSFAEWVTLEDYLIANGYNYDGSTTNNKLAKAMAAKTNWITSSESGTPGNTPELNNSSRFGALPGGLRGDQAGNFSYMGTLGIWWTSTLSEALDYYDNPCAWKEQINATADYSFRSDNGSLRYSGHSIRCIKD